MKMRFVCLVIVLLLTLPTIRGAGEEAPDSNQENRRWHFFFEELKIQQLLAQLSNQHRPQKLAVVNVNLISMNKEEVLPNRTVMVSNGKIESIGNSGEVRVPKDYNVINGEGRFLMPGLVDMHVHNLVSSSQHLLNLANGVTTVRDMDGFRWMLQLKRQVADNRVLAPNLYVAGHILNARPMGMYATVVDSPEDGRRIVREQKEQGYEFIKVHNNLPIDRYQAISDEAKKVKLDVIGHIPHDVRVAQAVAAGQRTFEHFKGYILDRNLALTDEDYVQATRNAPVWNCPTFYTYREHLSGDPAKELVRKNPQMKYVSWRDKDEWIALADETDNPELLAARRNILPLSKKIFRDLLAIDAQFIAGTDSGGGYAYMVPGFALHEELNIMNEQGLSAYETLKAATSNAAEAMRKQAEFGTVEAGKRADLLLLNSNPLQKVSHLSRIEAVSVRGIWLSRAVLDSILQKIETIYNPPPSERVVKRPSESEMKKFVQAYGELQASGFVFRSHDLEKLRDLLQKAGLASEADGL